MTLTLQFLTVSIIILQRHLIHLQISSRNSWNNAYDYIVVGAGTSGSAVAVRLSEDKNVNVLLLEAGGPSSIITDIPGLLFSLVGSEFDWKYYSVPQEKMGLAYVDRRVPQPRGKGIGGTSLIDYMYYNRGNKKNYDEWEQRFGAKGWSYNKVLPYFLKCENNTDPDIVSEYPEYHGVGGPISVSTPTNPDPILYRFIEELDDSNGRMFDLNGPSQLGVGIPQQAYNHIYTKQSVVNAYLAPNRNRKNLHIISRAFVTKIIFTKTQRGHQATGVQFVREGRTSTVSAKREIIVSAGVFSSPQLLMLSGIGPKDHLRQFNIPVIADLPVGNNLQDHIKIQLDYQVTNREDVTSGMQINPDTLYDYFINHSGPLTLLPYVMTYYSTRVNDDPEWPDAGIIFHLRTVPSNLTQVVSEYGSNIREWEDYWRPYIGDDQWFAAPIVLFRIKSRGTVRLASKDPFVYPLIDPKYYSNPQDLDAMVDTLRQTWELMNRGSLPTYTKIIPPPIPGCTLCESGTVNCEAYLRCVATLIGRSDVHPTGTCRMGSGNDVEAVVDERLRVRGVSGLRVIDASIMPEVMNGHPSSVALMIAEYGSDMVKEDNNK